MVENHNSDGLGSPGLSVSGKSVLPQAVMVYVTTPGRDSAETIAGNLIKRRLAACANILDGMSSMFFWEGDLRHEQECVVILKTRRQAMASLVAAVKILHPYECPCVVGLPIVDGDADFIQWIETQTTPLMEPESNT